MSLSCLSPFLIDIVQSQNSFLFHLNESVEFKEDASVDVNNGI